VQLQLLEDVADVVLHGVLGDEELLGDVAVVQAARHELEHLELALGQPRGGHLVPLVGLLDHRGELAEQLRRHRRADQRLAAGDRTDRAGDLVDRDLLEQVARRAGLDRLVEVGLLVGDRQHHDLRARHDVLDRGAGLDPGAARHPHVHQDDVGEQGRGLGHRFGAVGRLADHLDVRLLAEDHLETTAEERVVVDDEDADRLPSSRGDDDVLRHDVPSRWPRLLLPPHDDGRSARSAPVCPATSPIRPGSRTERSQTASRMTP
jgi:hypothetical protein